jgi:hypothetical protein
VQMRTKEKRRQCLGLGRGRSRWKLIGEDMVIPVAADGQGPRETFEEEEAAAAAAAHDADRYAVVENMRSLIAARGPEEDTERLAKHSSAEDAAGLVEYCARESAEEAPTAKTSRAALTLH